MPARKSAVSPVNMDNADEPVYNTFTKSYPNRKVVHASRVGDKKTICGRAIAQTSDVPFDVDIPGSCEKCIQKMGIEKRTHPGWEG